MRMREVGKMGKMDPWEKDYGSASKMNCKMRFRDDAFLRGILWQEGASFDTPTEAIVLEFRIDNAIL